MGGDGDRDITQDYSYLQTRYRPAQAAGILTGVHLDADVHQVGQTLQAVLVSPDSWRWAKRSTA